MYTTQNMAYNVPVLLFCHTLGNRWYSLFSKHLHWANPLRNHLFTGLKPCNRSVTTLFNKVISQHHWKKTCTSAPFCVYIYNYVVNVQHVGPMLSKHHWLSPNIEEKLCFTCVSIFLRSSLFSILKSISLYVIAFLVFWASTNISITFIHRRHNVFELVQRCIHVIQTFCVCWVISRRLYGPGYIHHLKPWWKSGLSCQITTTPSRQTPL